VRPESIRFSSAVAGSAGQTGNSRGKRDRLASPEENVIEFGAGDRAWVRRCPGAFEVPSRSGFPLLLPVGATKPATREENVIDWQVQRKT
jgi:hypothetical protein